MVKVTVDEKKNKIIIEADIETPRPSGSGKTLIVATTGGNLKTGQTIAGKPLTVGFNAYIPKD